MSHLSDPIRLSVPDRPSGPTRRGLLGGAAATLVGAGLVGAPAAARAHGPAADRVGATFAVVTDTHVNRDRPARTAMLARVMEHIDSRDPGFLVNCGDITDYGARHDFELYLSCLPDRLRDKAYQVPGNHEVQWNADAMSAFRDVFGSTRFSFDHAGLHVLGLDPQRSQEWSWRFGDELLQFVAEDLASLQPDTPVLVMTHYPLRVGGRAFVQDSDEFLRLIEPHPVRAIFAGHIHRREISQWNGLTQLLGETLKSDPVYFWCEDTTAADGTRVLRATEVRVPPTGEAIEEVVAEVRLDGPGPGLDLRPTGIDTTVARDVIRVRVDVPVAAPVGAVMARLDPQGAREADWVTLAGDDGRGRWRGTVDTSALPPGPHELIVRSAGGDGATFNSTVGFTINPGRTRVAWERRLEAPVQGGIGAHGNRVVVGSLSGRVVALDVTARAGRPRWSSRLDGGIFKAPVFTPAGDAVLVGSADHRLSSLDADTGQRRWQADLGAPVTCDIALGEVDGEPRVVVAAGTGLYCLDLDGTVQWRADLGGTFTGQPLCDGERVYAASGDGNAYAFDARTGQRLWTADCAPGRPDPYGRLIYGAWGARLRSLRDGGVIVTTHGSAIALEATTGAVRWTFDGVPRSLFTAPTVTEHGVLVFDGKNGDSHLLDAATGTDLWADQTLPCSFGAAPVVHPDGSTLSMIANNGTLVRYDLRRRTAVPMLQVSHTFTTSTPALLTDRGRGEFLVTVAKDGVLRGVVGLRGGPF